MLPFNIVEMKVEKKWLQLSPIIQLKITFKSTEYYGTHYNADRYKICYLNQGIIKFLKRNREDWLRITYYIQTEWLPNIETTLYGRNRRRATILHATRSHIEFVWIWDFISQYDKIRILPCILEQVVTLLRKHFGKQHTGNIKWHRKLYHK